MTARDDGVVRQQARSRLGLIERKPSRYNDRAARLARSCLPEMVYLSFTLVIGGTEKQKDAGTPELGSLISATNNHQQQSAWGEQNHSHLGAGVTVNRCLGKQTCYEAF